MVEAVKKPKETEGGPTIMQPNLEHVRSTIKNGLRQFSDLEEYLKTHSISEFNANWVAFYYLAYNLAKKENDAELLGQIGKINSAIDEYANKHGYTTSKYDISKFEGKKFEVILYSLSSEFKAPIDKEIVSLNPTIVNEYILELKSMARGPEGEVQQQSYKEQPKKEESFQQKPEQPKEHEEKQSQPIQQQPKKEEAQPITIKPSQEESSNSAVPLVVQKVIEKYNAKIERLKGKESPFPEKQFSKIQNAIINEINEVNSQLSRLKKEENKKPELIKLLEAYSKDLNELNKIVADIIINKKKGLEGLKEFHKYLNDMAESVKKVSEDIESLSKEKKENELVGLKLPNKIYALASFNAKTIRKVESKMHSIESKIKRLEEKEKNMIEKKNKEIDKYKKKQEKIEEKEKEKKENKERSITPNPARNLGKKGFIMSIALVAIGASVYGLALTNLALMGFGLFGFTLIAFGTLGMVISIPVYFIGLISDVAKSARKSREKTDDEQKKKTEEEKKTDDEQKKKTEEEKKTDEKAINILNEPKH